MQVMEFSINYVEAAFQAVIIHRLTTTKQENPLKTFQAASPI